MELKKKKNPKKQWWYNMEELGFHYRITDFQCAMGISQLSKLSKFIKKRETIANKYFLSFKNIQNCKLLSSSVSEIKKSNHLFVLKINFKKIKKTKKNLIDFLKKKRDWHSSALYTITNAKIL
jgi:dTDP-4-amino-4,6-dideoxygalactose transaminase